MAWAQANVRGTYERYAEQASSLGMTGAQVARTILAKMGVSDVKVESVAGQLTDHYDPSAKAVRLSEGIYNSSSLSAAAIAAHECGHVLQDVEGYQFMNFRASMVPAANLGSQFGPMLVLGGFFLNIAGLINVGIVLFAAALLFHVVTLPVEFDASSRALKLVDRLGILQGEENKGARAVLNAAAWTYVATAVYAGLQLLQYIIIARGRD
ncbi:zinc metallopeptidase [Synechococcus sp. PCC 7336]|uniref:zinc metallopeptidase n=1 Tax=Synechococcus sp. PCC 7336 TaxID=195250 RepID=UPI003510487E